MRLGGIVPGIVYGSDQEPENLEFNEHDLNVFLHKTGEYAIVQLKIGEKSSTLAVIADIQYHPVTDRILHVDFKRIPRDKPVEIKVSIEFVGDSVGVRSGGLFMPRFHELKIKALPDEVPDKIEIDITDIDFDNALHARDLVMPEGVELLHEPEQTIVTIIKPRGAEEEEGEEEELETAEGEEEVSKEVKEKE